MRIHPIGLVQVRHGFGIDFYHVHTASKALQQRLGQSASARTHLQNLPVFFEGQQCRYGAPTLAGRSRNVGQGVFLGGPHRADGHGSLIPQLAFGNDAHCGTVGQGLFAQKPRRLFASFAVQTPFHTVRNRPGWQVRIARCTSVPLLRTVCNSEKVNPKKHPVLSISRKCPLSIHDIQSDCIFSSTDTVTLYIRFEFSIFRGLQRLGENKMRFGRKKLGVYRNLFLSSYFEKS